MPKMFKVYVVVTLPYDLRFVTFQEGPSARSSSDITL